MGRAIFRDIVAVEAFYFPSREGSCFSMVLMRSNCSRGLDFALPAIVRFESGLRRMSDAGGEAFFGLFCWR